MMRLICKLLGKRKDYEGFIDTIDRYFCVRGWARSLTDVDAKVTLELFNGETRLGETVARNLREDLRLAGKGDGYHGFSFQLDPKVLQGVDLDIRARIKGGGFSLPRLGNCEIQISPIKNSIYNGACEAPRGLSVRGWVYNMENPDITVEVEVCDGEQPLIVLPANEFRPDIKRLGMCKGYCGFIFILPEQFFDGKRHVLNVRTRGDHISLRNCPEVFLPQRIRQLLGDSTRQLVSSGMKSIEKMRDGGLL